jgi:glutamate racemase
MKNILCMCKNYEVRKGSMNIGFFDSGLGGLILLKAVARELPQYDYIYYGDTANLPYGDKTEEEIFEYTKQAIEELFKRDCLLVIVACNTASAETIRKLQDTYLRETYPERRILGVIVPTVEEAVEQGHTRAVLIATKRTVESGKYERELKKLTELYEIESIAAPALVPLIEAHQRDEAIERAVSLLEGVIREGDVVVLGCTHYTLLKEALRERFAGVYTFISQDEVIPKKLADYLNRHDEISSLLSGTGKREIILTEHRPDYDRIIADFLGGAYIPDES